MSIPTDPTFCFNLERLREALLSPFSLDIEELRTELATTRTELKGDLEGVKNTLESQITDAQSALSTGLLQAQTALQTEIDGVKNALESQLTGVQSALSSELAETRTALTTELVAIRGMLTPMSLNIERLQTELTNIKNTLTPIPSDIRDLRTDLTVIKNMLEQMQNSVSHSGLKSVQRGTLILPTREATKDVTISPVNTNKAFLSVNVAATSCVSGGGNHQEDIKDGIAASISAPNKITFSRPMGSDYNVTYCTIAWEVIEFY